MQLYQFPLSPNCKRVRVMAAELGIELEVKNLDFRTGDAKAPAYLALNPMGKVPTLVDGDFVLWESPAILTYLARKHGKLLPDDARGLAETVRWTTWHARHLDPAVGTVVFERLLKVMQGGQPDPRRVDDAAHEIARYAPVLDHQLAGREWIIGAFTIADISIGTSIEVGAMAKVDWSAYPNVTAWFERLRARPSWKA